MLNAVDLRILWHEIFLWNWEKNCNCRLEKQASLGMGNMELRRTVGAWRNKRLGIAYIWVHEIRDS
jgi:hypothetical protein